MDKTIHQTYRGNYKKYEIKEKGLFVESKKANDYIAYLVEYDSIGFDEVVCKLVPSRYEYLIFGSVVLNVLLLVVIGIQFIDLLWLKFVIAIVPAIALFFLAKRLFRLRKTKILEGDQNVSFFYFEEQKEEVDAFIEKIKTYRKKYLRGKYMKYDELDDEDRQKNIYMWLYREELISREELRDLNEEIINGRIIGGF